METTNKECEKTDKVPEKFSELISFVDNIKLEDFSVLVFRHHALYYDADYQKMLRRLDEKIHRVNPNVAVLVITGDITIQSLSEAQMEKLGWVRARVKCTCERCTGIPCESLYDE